MKIIKHGSKYSEDKNSNFSLEAKFESMIKIAKKIINQNKNNIGDCSIETALAYDVANYLPKVLKENEELKIIKSAIQTLQINSLEEEKYIVISKGSFLDGSYKHLLDDYIPVQKIKDIINRIDYDIKKTKEIASYRKNDYQIVRLKAMNTKSLDIKNRLQELLESEE